MKTHGDHYNKTRGRKEEMLSVWAVCGRGFVSRAPNTVSTAKFSLRPRHCMYRYGLWMDHLKKKKDQSMNSWNYFQKGKRTREDFYEWKSKEKSQVSVTGIIERFHYTWMPPDHSSYFLIHKIFEWIYIVLFYSTHYIYFIRFIFSPDKNFFFLRVFRKIIKNY